MLTKLAREKSIRTRSVAIQTQEKTTRSAGIQTTCKQRRRKYLTKRKQAGQDFREALSKIGTAWRRRYHSKAADLLRVAAQTYMDPDIPPGITANRRFGEIAKEMSDLLFCVGDLQSVQKILLRFTDRPELRVLMSPEVADYKTCKAGKLMLDNCGKFLSKVFDTKGSRTV